MADNKSNIWALLVGINEYISPGIKTLHGCVNDVQAMQQFLMNQMILHTCKALNTLSKKMTKIE
jgi:hypothetical protein